MGGQTTAEFGAALARHKAKRHLLPAGVTDELQLIDDGIGIAVKNEMGNAFDAWAMEDDNLARWTADSHNAEEGVQPMTAADKRILLTHLAAAAWEKVCSTFDFEKAATRLTSREQ